MKWTDLPTSPVLPTLTESHRERLSTASRLLCAGTGSAHEAVVAIDASVHAQVLAQLRASRLEQGGLLLGIPYGEPGNTGEPVAIEVIAAVAADDASGTGYSLRMAAAVWSAANARLHDLRVQRGGGTDDCRVVGWYHSHPGLGAFFSATDCATQRAFFHHPWSIGWVIDPSDDTHACFIGADSSAVGRCLLIG